MIAVARTTLILLVSALALAGRGDLVLGGVFGLAIDSASIEATSDLASIGSPDLPAELAFERGDRGTGNPRVGGTGDGPAPRTVGRLPAPVAPHAPLPAAAWVEIPAERAASHEQARRRAGALSSFGTSLPPPPLT